MGRTNTKHEQGSAVTNALTRYTIVESEPDGYATSYIVRYGKSATASGFQTSPTVAKGEPFVVLGYMRGMNKQASGEQLTPMRPRDAMLYARSIIDAVNELMPDCGECGGTGTITSDILEFGTEHSTREETCDKCSGEGRVLA